MSKRTRFLVAIICVFGLLYIRFRESAFFYDPLIDYFHGDYQNNTLPVLITSKFYLNIIFRYGLNMVLSLGILWAAFADIQIVKFSSYLYVIAFVMLIAVLYVLMIDYDPQTYVPLFYVRRFLIQPLLIILLLPAFFYSRTLNR